MKKLISLVLLPALCLALAASAMADGFSPYELEGSYETQMGKVTYTLSFESARAETRTLTVRGQDGTELELDANVILAAPGSSLTVDSKQEGGSVIANTYAVENGVLVNQAKPVDLPGELAAIQDGSVLACLPGDGDVLTLICYGETLNAGTLVSSESAGYLPPPHELSPSDQEAGIMPLSETAPDIPATGAAYASTQSVEVDGRAVEFQMYALKDENGSPTNYVKARDVASVLNGTKAQFEVGYDNAAKVVDLIPGQAYTANGSEMQTPFSGDRAYTVPATATHVNGAPSELKAILLTSDSGGGFTYYKLRDLGKALGFNVGWSKAQGVFIETDKPYEG